MTRSSGPWRRRVRSLGGPLLAALVLHGLWLAWLSLRPTRTGAAPPLRSADDTPELLVFSRQPPEPLPAASGPPPPPPPSAAPPPPLLPRHTSRHPDVSVSPSRAAAPRPERRRPAARSQPSQAKPPAPARPGPAGASALAQAQPRQPPPAIASPSPSEALRQARLRTLTAADLLEGEAGQRWRALWRAAAPAGPRFLAPAALAAAAGTDELRWLPLDRLRAQGLDPESGRVYRLDDTLLLVWQEADAVWLLRTPL